MSEDSSATSVSLRIDKWLWCARFFKSRAQATEAVAGGRVHVNGERAKPSRVVRIDDRIEITRDEVRFDLVVRGIPLRRGPATEAQDTLSGDAGERRRPRSAPRASASGTAGA